MKFKVVFFLLLISFVAKAQKITTYILQEEDEIEHLAARLNVLFSDIKLINPEIKSMSTGDTLVYPIYRPKFQPNDSLELEVDYLKEHHVKKRETIYSISRLYNVTVNEIKKHNSRLYSEPLLKGDLVNIPIYKDLVKREKPSLIKIYKILEGETILEIAYRYDVTLRELTLLNQNFNSEPQEGQFILVPNEAEDESIEGEFLYYEVQPKEGYYRLSLKLGVTQEDLEKFNPILLEEGLKQGMILKYKIEIDSSASNLIKNDTISNLNTSISNLNKKRIALILPFNLKTIDVDTVANAKRRIKNSKLLRTLLDFKIGAQYALDSLARKGVSSRIEIIDSEGVNSKSIDSLIALGKFQNFDAIVGPLSEVNFLKVAKSVQEDSIPVISPLAYFDSIPSNGVNSLVHKDIMRERTLNFVENDSLKKTITFISDRKHSVIVDSLVTSINFSSSLKIVSQLDRDENDAYFLNLDIENLQSDFNKIKNHLKEGVNYVLLETDNEGYVSNVTSMLNGLVTDEIKIILTTSQKNKAFDGISISNKHLTNLNFHYVSSYNPSFKSNSFISRFTKDYGVTPSRYSIRGFDLFYDLGLRLSSSELGFIELVSNPVKTEYIQNSFDYRNYNGSIINISSYLLKYDNLNIEVVK